jgi:hypothetical protein
MDFIAMPRLVKSINRAARPNSFVRLALFDKGRGACG